ncbi:unnamed protein product, partial [Trichobilharzia regenti]
SFLTRLILIVQRDIPQLNAHLSGSSDSVTDQISATPALMNSSSVVGNRSVSGSPRTSASRTKVFQLGFQFPH